MHWEGEVRGWGCIQSQDGYLSRGRPSLSATESHAGPRRDSSQVEAYLEAAPLVQWVFVQGLRLVVVCSSPPSPQHTHSNWKLSSNNSPIIHLHQEL